MYHILICDDEQDIINALKIYLADPEYRFFEAHSGKEALEMLLHSPVFALTYDVGHDHGCGGLDAAYIGQNAAHLTHMHLHDALGRKNHLPLGTGEIDLNACLRLADAHDCRVVLETKTVEGLRQSVRWLRSWQSEIQ